MMFDWFEKRLGSFPPRRNVESARTAARFLPALTPWDSLVWLSIMAVRCSFAIIDSVDVCLSRQRRRTGLATVTARRSWSRKPGRSPAWPSWCWSFCRDWSCCQSLDQPAGLLMGN